MSNYLAYEMYRVLAVGGEDQLLDESPRVTLTAYGVDVDRVVALGAEWVLAPADSYDPCDVPAECGRVGMITTLEDGSRAVTGTDGMCLWYFKVVQAR